MRFCMGLMTGVTALSIIAVAVGCSPSQGTLDDVRQHLRTGDYNEAKRIVDEMVAADSTSPEAICAQGYIQEYMGFDWDALMKYLEAAKLNDGHLPSMKAFTRVAIDDEHFENARRMAEILTQFQPENPAWHLALSEIDVYEEKFDSAARRIEIADSLGADDADLAIAQARAGLYSYDPETVRQALDLLSRTSFATPDQYARAASLYRYMNMLDSAIAMQRRAVDKVSDDITYRSHLARYLFEQRRLWEAYDIVGPMVEEHDRFGPARIALAYVLQENGETIQADYHFMTYVKFKEYTPVALEKHGDFFSYFDKTNLAQGEFLSAYLMAANLEYADDYLRRLYLKMVNSFFDDEYIPLAIEYFEEGKELLGSSSLDMYFFEAELNYRFPQTMDSARMMVDDKLDKHWNDREWLDLAAKYYYRGRMYDRAASVYRRLTELKYPKEIYFERLLAIYERDKNARAADTLARQLPLRFQNSRPVREKFYDVYVACDEIEQATAYAEVLYENAPGYMPYLLNLTDLYARQDRIDRARQLLARYISDHPKDPEGHYRLGRFELEHGMSDSVLVRVERTLNLDSTYAYAYELKGMYFQQQGNIDSAVEAYSIAVGYNWPTPEAYYNLANYYYQQDDSLNYAAGLAMAAARYFENDKRGYQLLGDIYYAQAKFKLARLQYFKGQRMFPDDPELLFLLGKAHIKVEAPDEAKKFLRQAIDKGLTDPQLTEARELLAKL